MQQNAATIHDKIDAAVGNSKKVLATFWKDTEEMNRDRKKDLIVLQKVCPFVCFSPIDSLCSPVSSSSSATPDYPEADVYLPGPAQASRRGEQFGLFVCWLVCWFLRNSQRTVLHGATSAHSSMFECHDASKTKTPRSSRRACWL